VNEDGSILYSYQRNVKKLRVYQTKNMAEAQCRFLSKVGTKDMNYRVVEYKPVEE
jgi:hypothetical protein